MVLASVNHIVVVLVVLVVILVLKGVILGHVNDSPERAEAIRIIQQSRRDGGDYKNLSKADQGTLLALLQENRDARETVIIGKPQLQHQDIRTTMVNVNTEVFLVQRIHPTVLPDIYI